MGKYLKIKMVATITFKNTEFLGTTLRGVTSKSLTKGYLRLIDLNLKPHAISFIGLSIFYWFLLCFIFLLYLQNNYYYRRVIIVKN